MTDNWTGPLPSQPLPPELPPDEQPVEIRIVAMPTVEIKPGCKYLIGIDAEHDTDRLDRMAQAVQDFFPDSEFAFVRGATVLGEAPDR